MPYEAPEPPEPFSLPYRGDRLRWAIEVIGWDHNQCGRRLDMDRGTLRQMLANRRFIPDVLAIWIEGLAQYHLTFAKPMGWRPKPSREPDRFGYDPDEPQQKAEPIVLDNETV